MKKLMIAAAIVCAAAMSQASQIKWSLADVTAKGSETTAGYTAYFFIASDSSGSTPTAKILALADAEALAAKGDVAALAAAATMTDNLTKDGGVTTSLTPNNTAWVKNVVVESFAIVMNNEDPSKATYYAVALDVDSEPVALASNKFSGSTAKPTANVFQYGDWTAVSSVPEPTSGLLLLLGVAGLALRRRRA